MPDRTPESPRQVPRRHRWPRRAAVRVAEGLARCAGGRALYRRRYLSAGRLIVRTERIAPAALPADLEGYRIVQLSDLHAGVFLGAGDLEHVLERTLALAPDAIVLTGDFVTHCVDEAWPILDDLARLRARDGVFAVFGNHDYKHRREGELERALEARGIRVLRNSSVRVRRGTATLAFVGVEDLEEGKLVDIALARARVEPDDVEIVLCHNPLGAPSFARACCAVVLSGHSHGTQVDLPFARRAGPPHPGLRVDLGPTALIVSRGLGTIGLPLRVGAPAEIVVVELERGAA